ncbi:SxtJ family membrane protein [Leadbetterella sp. DM7]|uniref:SxtJ family membrane protein n=1 Tax=Leadbetterella sp. DM7 TaxID=3235085 RepID=UPI00349E61A9
MTEETLKNQDRTKSILVIVVGFLALYALFRFNHREAVLWGKFKTDYFLFISLGVGILSLVSSAFQDMILWVWFKIALVLGYINTRIILGLVFFLFLTPFALLQKIFVRKNFLSLKDKGDTVYHTRNHAYQPEDFDNIW